MPRFVAIAVLLAVSLLTAAPAAAYHPPQIVRAVVVGLNNQDKAFRLYLRGPGNFDISSIWVYGPSQNYPIDPGNQVQGGAAVQTYATGVSGQGVPQNGDYTIEVTDNLGRSNSVTITYTDVTAPSITAGDITPADGSYTGTTTPTVSMTSQGGGMTYFFRIWDYPGQTIIWQSEPSSSNSVGVPSGVLQADTPYRLQSFVTPSDMSPSFPGLSMGLVTTYFHTGTRANPPTFGNSWIILNQVHGSNPLRHSFFRVPGLAPWDFNLGYFQVELTPPGGSANPEGLFVQTRLWEPCYYYSSTEVTSPPMTEGAYNFAITDNLANSINQDRTYSQETMTPPDPANLKPGQVAYVGSQYPMVTWQPPAGASTDWRYIVRLRRAGSDNTYIYNSGLLSGTSHVINPGSPLADNHTYILTLQIFTSSTAGANQYLNLGSTRVLFHLDSRLSNPGIHIPTVLH